MAQAQLSLCWDAYQKNICTGLTLLQQRGEFVDMTLAADGHHVKVHQMVLSLVSPYIKDLISSAQCPHPIIFLNNISYTTLSSILEYIYTGQVLVPKEKLNELLAAGRALHIRGLREMDEPEMPQPMDPINPITIKDGSPPRKKSIIGKLKERSDGKKSQMKEDNSTPSLPICKVFVDESDTRVDTPIELEQKPILITGECKKEETVTQDCTNSDVFEMLTPEQMRRTLMNPKIQYTVSNQGGLQVIYNRYIYHLRYFGKKNRVRLWRCIDYSSTLKCPANICTDENNQVTTRSFTHNHPFHDNKVLKKLSFGRIYPAFSQAESMAVNKTKERRVPEDSFV